MNATSARSSSSLAFSLVEVVVALGVFAVAIVSVIGLLAPTARAVSTVIETDVAQRLAGNVNLELQRYGFLQVANGLPNATSRIYLVANRKGDRVLVTGEDPFTGVVATPSMPAEHKLAASATPGNPPGMALRDRYYLVEVRRATTPVLTDDAASIPLSIRISWPYRLPQGPVTETADDYNDDPSTFLDPFSSSDRSLLLLNVALTP